jgi:TonB family protein
MLSLTGITLLWAKRSFRLDSIMSDDKRMRRTPGLLYRVLASLSVHVVVILLVFVFMLRAVRVYRVKPASRCCMTARYWTNGMGMRAQPNLKASAGTTHSVEEAVKMKALLPTPAPPVKASAAQSEGSTSASSLGSPAQTKQQSIVTNGSGSGSQNAEPAYPIYSPSPHVADRALLPVADQNVIVDVDVSETGLVTNEKLIRGLGNNIDQVVMDTVKAWRFHPAMVDGTAVPSVAELVFPLNQAYPETGA